MTGVVFGTPNEPELPEISAGSDVIVATGSYDPDSEPIVLEW
jgi:hypothetical protein